MIHKHNQWHTTVQTSDTDSVGIISICQPMQTVTSYNTSPYTLLWHYGYTELHKSQTMLRLQKHQQQPGWEGVNSASKKATANTQVNYPSQLIHYLITRAWVHRGRPCLCSAVIVVARRLCEQASCGGVLQYVTVWLCNKPHHSCPLTVQLRNSYNLAKMLAHTEFCSPKNAQHYIISIGG